MTSLRKFAWILLAFLVAAPASAATFDATMRGWYSHAGLHTDTKLDTFAGQGSGTDRYRVFFVFDLGTLARPAGSGVLRLELQAVLGPDAAESFSVYDVNSNLDDLVASQTNRADIYADLGSGVYYGIGAAFANAVGSIIEIPLEPDAIADINRAAGGRFAVGVFVETLRLPVGSEGVRFSLASEARVHQLVLTDAPTLPSLSLAPDLASAVPPSEHAVDAQLVDGDGAPIADALIAFSVVSGPNAGATASVATDANGAAHFAYAGGAAGVDRIHASLNDAASGAALDEEALAFWDADCNANAIPDTCDLACGGFGGECAAFEDCGGGVDADSNGVLDECGPVPVPNAPPDCSQAAILPSMLRRANHQFQAIGVSGVTDPDGDAIQVTIEEVFQDEPVESFACGGAGKADAIGLGTAQVKLRAESLERGDGRVYHVGFSADDGRGGSCEGTASVCVPRNGLRRSDRCVDQGPLYDSTEANERKHFRRGWRWHGRH